MLRALAVSFAMLAAIPGPCAAETIPPAADFRDSVRTNNDARNKTTNNLPTPNSNSAAGASSGEDSAAESELLEAANKSRDLAGVPPFRVVAIGALLSFGIEFSQQWIPGRDPSLGDIVCNTISTALGVLLVVAAPIWLWAPPRRSVWQARLTAVIAALALAPSGLFSGRTRVRV